MYCPVPEKKIDKRKMWVSMYCPVPDKKKTREKSVFLCTAPFL